MTTLGQISIRNGASVIEARKKITALAEALQFSEILSTRLGTITSEIARQILKNGDSGRISVEVGKGEGGAGLVLVFHTTGSLPDNGYARKFFDSVSYLKSRGDSLSLHTFKRMSKGQVTLDHEFVKEQRRRIQRRSREGLLEQLQSKNLELERHREKLEQTVAERTRKLERQAMEAKLMHRTAELGTEADSIDEALQRVVRLVCELTKWPVGHVYEPSPKQADELIPTTIWHFGDEKKYAMFKEVTARTNFMTGEGLPGRILESGKPVWIVNVQKDTNFPRNRVAADLGVRGAFGFPVKIGKEVVAVLEFFADEEVEPDEQLLLVMANVGAQLGGMFERRRAEEDIKRKNEQLRKTLRELKNTQSQLIQSEKMAALGQLIAGVAHEVNTPLGAIRSSVGNISSALGQVLRQLPDFYQRLAGEEQSLFLKLLDTSLDNKTILTSKEARRARRAMVPDLDDAGVEDPDAVGDVLVDMGVMEGYLTFLPLIQHASGREILEMAYKLTSLKRSAENITLAADKAAKVVFALKSYSHYEISGEKTEANIVDGIETVLTLYQNQIKHGIEVVRSFQQVEPILCYPDELNQVWTNLIHNSLQAMGNNGTLHIDISKRGSTVQVSITDSGPGIPKEIQQKIFEPFFTTKAQGVGSGLGLDITKKIVSKHQGEVTVMSEPGKTTFSVILPIK